MGVGEGVGVVGEQDPVGVEVAVLFHLLALIPEEGHVGVAGVVFVWITRASILGEAGVSLYSMGVDGWVFGAVVGVGSGVAGVAEGHIEGVVACLPAMDKQELDDRHN